MKSSPMTPSFWRRLSALFIDYLVILAWMLCVGLVSFAFFGLVLKGFPNYLAMLGPVLTQLVFFMILTFPVGLYLYLCESGRYHATLGKRVCSIEVVSTNGKLPSKRQVAIRTVVKLLPWEIAHTFVWQLQYKFYMHGYETAVPLWIMIGLCMAMVLAAGYVIVVAVRRDGRGPHDAIAGTKVVKL